MVGTINHILGTKSKKQVTSKLSMNQEKPFNLQKIIESNRMQYDRYTQVEKVSREKPAVDPSADEAITIGALTDFNLKKNDQRTDNQNGEDDTQDSVSLTPEEIEKKRVEEFRKKRKEDIEVLQDQYDALQGNLVITKIKART